MLVVKVKGKLWFEAPRREYKHTTTSYYCCEDHLDGEKSDGVTLVQDDFGCYYYEDGRCVRIKRFTWTNRNRIQVQVINYGARVISIKYPDRKGEIDDIVLGFDDLAGYIHYKQYYLGATIGRMSNVIRNSKFNIGNKEYCLVPNMKNGNHRNGGSEGFDQVIWKTWVNEKKVFMTHLSPHGHQGYPGHLLVQITFELSSINDFKIDIVAYSTEPTIINLTNLLYLNLGGHNAGSDSIYKHIVAVNCNCYTTQDDEGFCSGDIWNVVHTPFDVQAPVVLGTLMGLAPNDGFSQNMCLNKGVDQDECFVARIRYPPSGRLVEVYSNQHGVQFDTANHFCKRWSPVEIILHKELLVPQQINLEEITLNIIEYLQKKKFEQLKEKLDSSFRNFKEYVRLLIECNYEHISLDKTSTVTPRRSSTRKDSLIIILEDNTRKFTCSLKQLEYLKTLRVSLEENNLKMDHFWLHQLIEKLIFFAETNAKKTAILDTTLKRDYSDSVQSTKSMQPEVGGDLATPKSRVDNVTSQKNIAEKVVFDDITTTDKLVQEKQQPERKKSHESGDAKKIESNRSSLNVEERKEVKERVVTLNKNIPLKMPVVPPKRNIIPTCYTACDSIVGKGGARYERHGGVAFQTQNYPNCANIKSFPRCILKPGEKYRHTIKYKFWIRPGDPSKWVIKMEQDIAELKRNL